MPHVPFPIPKIMLRRYISIITAILLSLVLVACTAATTPSNNTTTDTTPKVAQRVITLTSLTSDILYRLDKTKIVGMVGSRLFAQDSRFQNIPKVSEGQTLPNLEKLISLKPDLVIGNKDFHAQILPKLKELGIATIGVTIKKWDDLTEITKTVADAIAVDSTPLLTRYQTFLEKPAAASPSTLVLVSRQPILSPNKNSWSGDLLTKFGIKNIVADLQANSPLDGYFTLSAEKILQANPEAILIVDQPSGKISEQFKSEPFWSKLKATQNNRIYVFDYYGLVNPGSLDKIEETCQKLTEVVNKNRA
ncbi:MULTISPECIES: ABC transporter substrate-binding protein [Oscillatoriales]|nr:MULTISPECIES: ABC transporter substrate-binding protein [Oscillatoriales]